MYIRKSKLELDRNESDLKLFMLYKIEKGGKMVTFIEITLPV